MNGSAAEAQRREGAINQDCINEIAVNLSDILITYSFNFPEPLIEVSDTSPITMGFPVWKPPGGSEGKDSACSAGDVG